MFVLLKCVLRESKKNRTPNSCKSTGCHVFDSRGDILSRRASEHTTPLFRDLHWLRVPERIQFGCVFWHITVCMAQHRRILQTACGRHQTSPSSLCRHNYAAGAADSSCNSWRPRLSDGSGAGVEQSASTDQDRLVADVFSAADKSPSVSPVVQLTSDYCTIVFFLNLICKVLL